MIFNISVSIQSVGITWKDTTSTYIIHAVQFGSAHATSHNTVTRIVAQFISMGRYVSGLHQQFINTSDNHGNHASALFRSSNFLARRMSLGDGE